MRHQWTATRKEMAALTADGTFAGAEDAGDEDGAVRTPKKRASAKSKLNHTAGIPLILLTKVAGGTPKKTKTAAKVKVEAVKEEVDGEEEDFEDANE